MDPIETERRDNSVVGVKMLNIVAGRRGLHLPGKPPRGASGDAASHTDTQKTQSTFFVTLLSRLVSTLRCDKAPIMMFHFDRFI